jgi:hypothetical protein
MCGDLHLSKDLQVNLVGISEFGGELQICSLLEKIPWLSARSAVRPTQFRGAAPGNLSGANLIFWWSRCDSHL